MLQQRTRKACGPRGIMNRIVVAALAASAIVPAAAVAQPADSVKGSTPALTQDFRSADARDSATNLATGQDLRSPDAADAGVTTRPGYPSQSGSPVKVVEAPAVPDDGGIDTGVLIALIGGGVLLMGGIAIATRHRLQVARQRVTA